MAYKRTQTGWVVLGFCVGVMILFELLPTRGEPREFCLPLLALLLLLLVTLMGTLTVEVDNRAIRLRFGIGLVRKTFSLADVASCRPVRNKWWWGWGIRLIPAARCKGVRCWLYNVSGLNAVELVMTNGKVFRIGTEEPQRLSDVIAVRLNKLA